MKKIILKIVVCALALTLCLSAVGCKKDKWEGTTMKNWGAINASTNGGFLAETENYIYFINGLGVNTDDNTFGAPVKGALVAADKSDLSKSQVVVPKLFVAADYKAGVYLFGSGNNSYVYYATPSTEKNAQGGIANTSLTFMRTKLDGSATDTYFTYNALDVQYRFVEVGGKVYILYYDSAESALKCYNTTDKSTIEIAKTDAETNDVTSEEYRTLASFWFVEGVEGINLLYTTTVYSEEYYEDKAETSNYSRATQNYNQVYSYAIGNSKTGAFYGKEVLNGKNTKTTYTVKKVDNGTVYFSETIDSVEKTYCSAVGKISEKTEIKQPTLIADTTLIVSPTKAYYVESGKVFETDLTKTAFTDKLVLVGEDISTLKFVNGEDMFYLDANQKLFKKAMNDADAKAIEVFENAVATAWFNYETVQTKDGKLLFALDGTSTTASYIKYVNIDKAYKAEDTDDDGENDKFYLEGVASVGVMTDADSVEEFKIKLGAIAGATIDGKSDDADKVIAEYNKLSAKAKESLADEQKAQVENVKKANEIAKILIKLEDIIYGGLDAQKTEELKAIYKSAKTEIEKLGENETTVRALMTNNLNFLYQKATEKFA